MDFEVVLDAFACQVADQVFDVEEVRQELSWKRQLAMLLGLAAAYS